LAGGNIINFQTTAGFSADSNQPVQPNGINPGEFLQIIFSLQSGGTLQDVYNELVTGELRIGIHVQGFDSGGSESFINTPPTSVPEPTTMLLFGLGLLGVAGFGRMKLIRREVKK
jgi:hypothetical protein